MSVPYSKRNHTKIPINYRDITTSFPPLSYSNSVFTISLITQQPLRVTKTKVYYLKAIFTLYNPMKKSQKFTTSENEALALLSK